MPEQGDILLVPIPFTDLSSPAQFGKHASEPPLPMGEGWGEGEPAADLLWHWFPRLTGVVK